MWALQRWGRTTVFLSRWQQLSPQSCGRFAKSSGSTYRRVFTSQTSLELTWEIQICFFESSVIWVNLFHWNLLKAGMTQESINIPAVLFIYLQYSLYTCSTLYIPAVLFIYLQYSLYTCSILYHGRLSNQNCLYV